jgi:uncharacterized protein YciW
MTNYLNTAAVRAGGIESGHPLADVLAGREDILTMTEQAHDAALTPSEPGGLSHGERAALACRMARLNRAEGLAAHFAGLVQNAGASETVANIADPGYDGVTDGRLAALIHHTDLVTRDTKSAAADDIAALTAAGVSEDDIVRLSELIAFVNYQARVAAGLRLMEALA